MDGGFTEPQALLVSLGTGIVNWLFAIPAIYTVGAISLALSYIT